MLLVSSAAYASAFLLGWLSGAAATKKFWYDPIVQRDRSSTYVLVNELSGETFKTCSRESAERFTDDHSGWTYGDLAWWEARNKHRSS